MLAFMKAREAQAYALMRIVTGFLFLANGSQKLLSFPVAAPPELPAGLAYTAGPIELVGGALIMLGLATRLAGFICSGQMAVAYWIGHGTRALLPIANGGELAVLYCFAFLFISARGAGIWSLDAARGECREPQHRAMQDDVDRPDGR